MKKVHVSDAIDLKPSSSLEKKRANKKTVSFVGLAPRTRERAPFDDLNVEIWTLGRAWRDHRPGQETWVKRISRHFEIHPESFVHLDNKPDELHHEWLGMPHPFTIYMDDKYSEFPSSERYPIEWAVQTFGRHFTSTMSYMFPIAERDGFERIEIYGFEMGFGGEYAYQMPEVAYHIGWFRALHGYDSVYIPPESKILRAPLYAYEEMYNPILTTIEQRIGALQKARFEEENKAAKFVGALEALNELNEEVPGIKEMDKWKEIQEKYREELRRQELLVNSIIGAYHENQVFRDAIYYVMPPSYKSPPKADLEEATVPWDDVDLPWREAENVTETREES